MRGLAAVAADPDASYDARLDAACRRVESAVLALAQPRPVRTELLAAPAHAPHHHPGAEAALTHLHALEGPRGAGHTPAHLDAVPARPRLTCGSAEAVDDATALV